MGHPGEEILWVAVDKQLDLLLDHPGMNSRNASFIQTMIDRINVSLSVIRILGVNMENWSPIIVRIAVRKLDVKSRTA